MLPAGGILEKARSARDARFDGRFFVGVRTTGIYCRPVCRVRLPRAENVVFFSSAAAAREAGYRPCLRCRPESSPGTPAWRGTSTTVSRALQLINEGALDEGSIATLCERLGVTTRHLSRLFSEHLGASPKTVAQTRRLQFAKKLIDESSLSMTEVAMAAGYGSVRRFNDHIVSVYGMPPSALRKIPRNRAATAAGDGVTLRLAFRAPYDASGLLAFFRMRATPGVEAVSGRTLSRTFVAEGQAGEVQVQIFDDHLLCAVRGGVSNHLMPLMQNVRRMFDLDALPADINQLLGKDARMGALVRSNPGQRLPGAFDPFETSVRAIVGQQVSMKGATTVMGRIAAQYGERSEYGLVFPSPERLANLDPASLSMPTARAMAIRDFSRLVADGDVRFDLPRLAFSEKVLAIKGIGPWTADYMAMRVLGDPDAFLHGDLVIRKVMTKLYDANTDDEILSIAEAWRPWRA